MDKTYGVVTRPCLYDSHRYVVGEQITSHDVADKLIALGFATHPTTEPPAAAPAVDAEPPTPPAGKAKLKES